jgi:hypothetical protein
MFDTIHLVLLLVNFFINEYMPRTTGNDRRQQRDVPSRPVRPSVSCLKRRRLAVHPIFSDPRRTRQLILLFVLVIQHSLYSEYGSAHFPPLLPLLMTG